MLSVKYIFLILFGSAGGFITAASYVAFITMIGIFPKVAAKTKTAKECILYENCIILGIMFSVGIQFFLAPNPSFTSIYSRTPELGCKLLLLAVGLFGGIYIGLLIGGLSECLNVFPIYAKKTHTKNTIRYAIYFLALGKFFFNLFQYFKL